MQYVGSITIDEDLMDAANIVENEKVQIVNVNNGERLETYVIKAERGSGTICLNGPAALKKKILKILYHLVFLALGILLLYFAFRGINLNELLIGLKSANYSWVFLSLIFAFLGFLIRAYRWNLLIEPLGYNPSLRNTFYAVAIGYLANFALPRLGEITRCGTLNKTENTPFDALLGTVFVERVIDVISLFLLILLIFFEITIFFKGG